MGTERVYQLYLDSVKNEGKSLYFLLIDLIYLSPFVPLSKMILGRIRVGKLPNAPGFYVFRSDGVCSSPCLELS
jgi:hypothetical protein